MEPTDTLKGLVLESIEALEKVHPRLTSCRVMIEQATRGIPHARLDIGIPGGELVVNREPPMDPTHRDVTQAVREAFEVARQQLREHRKRRSPDGKRRELLLPTAASCGWSWMRLVTVTGSCWRATAATSTFKRTPYAEPATKPSTKGWRSVTWRLGERRVRRRAWWLPSWPATCWLDRRGGPAAWAPLEARRTPHLRAVGILAMT